MCFKKYRQKKIYLDISTVFSQDKKKNEFDRII